jgi:tetratricopeptide (TPR) repeat protein
MRTNRIAGLVVVASLTVITVHAQQTAAEQMQKGIYTQETAGDLDGAIAIYRQIVNSGNSPRDLAAQAQYRLAQSLLQKGDLSNAAQEFEKLARSYADYGKLVSSLASMARGSTTATITFPGGRGGRGGGPLADANLTPEQRADQLKALEANVRALRAAAEAKAAGDANLTVDQRAADQAKFAIALARLTELQKAGALPGGGGGRGTGGGPLNSMSFDPLSTVTVKGAAFRIDLVFPSGSISVDPNDGTGKRYTFATAGPAELIRQGWTKDNIRLGDEVTITGLLATGGQTLPNGTIAASATTITAADGRKLFDRGAIQK